jgi:uncharacterized membrane protein HdeD (DUF308 family)
MPFVPGTGGTEKQQEGGKSQMPAFFTASTLGLWMGIVSLICGIIVMIFPKILNYLIGIYLIIIGVLALLAHFG